MNVMGHMRGCWKGRVEAKSGMEKVRGWEVKRSNVSEITNSIGSRFVMTQKQGSTRAGSYRFNHAEL